MEIETLMEVKCKCNSNFELMKEKRSHRKFVGEILTWTMKTHCLTQKCSKLNQFASSWTPASETAHDDNHQEQIIA